MSNKGTSANEVRHETTKEVLKEHDERITQNERFRLRMQGALTLIGFMLGGGVVTTGLAYLAGAL